MEEKRECKRIFAQLWFLSFFQGMAPGFWIPSLTNILKAEALGDWVPIAFAIPPICALFAPLIGGALADEKIPAQKLMGWSSLLAAMFFTFAFGALDLGLHPYWFLAGLSFYSITSGPSWGLLATLSLSHLKNSERSYPNVRLGATLGWMSAGYLASFVFHADTSLLCGYAAAAVKLITGGLAFFLPHTPSLGEGKSWKNALGIGAFRLFRERDHAVLLLVTGLFSIPLSAFYMYSGEMFQMLGDPTPSASMTIAQWSEVAAMPLLGILMTRFRLKTLLLWGLGLSVLRYGLSGYAGWSGTILWHLIGVGLHGVCYTLYFVSIQVFLDRRVDPALRGQAQGLLGLMTSGIGPLIGALGCAWLREASIDEKGQGWESFWWILASMIAICWLIFLIFYKGEFLQRTRCMRFPSASH